MDDLSRRRFVALLGLGTATAYLTSCASSTPLADSRPDPLWGTIARPRSDDGTRVSAAAPTGTAQRTTTQHTGQQTATSTAAAPVGPLKAIPRSRWATANPIAAKLNPMGKVNRITVHHEGWTVVDFDDAANTGKRMDSIRQSHLERLGAGDIGYHFVIDRAGRVWQGRDVKYQGAHVREHNPNNVGVMVLGNFDKQNPTDAQLTTLKATLISLQQTYRVPVKMVYTHQELNPTECPGKVLQARMNVLRRNGLA